MHGVSLPKNPLLGRVSPFPFPIPFPFPFLFKCCLFRSFFLPVGLVAGFEMGWEGSPRVGWEGGLEGGAGPNQRRNRTTAAVKWLSGLSFASAKRPTAVDVRGLWTWRNPKFGSGGKKAVRSRPRSGGPNAGISAQCPVFQGTGQKSQDEEKAVQNESKGRLGAAYAQNGGPNAGRRVQFVPLLLLCPKKT